MLEINTFCLTCFKKQSGNVRVCDRGVIFEPKIGHYLCKKHS